MNRVESRGTVKVPPSNARGGFLADDPEDGNNRNNDREWEDSQTPAPLRNARSFMDESTNRPRVIIPPLAFY